LFLFNGATTFDFRHECLGPLAQCFAIGDMDTTRQAFETGTAAWEQFF